MRSFHYSFKDCFKKAILLLLLLTPSTIFAAQAQVVVRGKSLTLKEIIQQIEKNSNYTFFYKAADLGQMPQQDINSEGSLEQVLEDVFKSSNIRYVIKGNEVILKTENEKNVISVATSGIKQQSKRVTVTGVVKDERGETVIGASIIESANHSNGTVTNIDGEYTLSVQEGAELVISYIGYINQTVKQKPGVTHYLTTMREDAQTLSEVVVVGYGTQKKVNLTGSVASISTDDLKDRVQTNVLSAVQGTVPGVTVISRPGKTPEINFRGRGNLGTSEPLYVIDGAIADATFFSNLDPNTIESISFLKDAASASIYGSRAAYGVVLVTTKAGQREKINVSYNGMVGLKMPTYLPDLVNSAEYATLLNEGLYNLKLNPNADKNQAYSSEEIKKFANGSDLDHYPNTNWMDLVLNDQVLTTQHSLNFSGGSDKIRFFTGLGYVYDDNFVPGKSDNRYNLSTNVNADVTKWLSLKAGIKYIRNEGNTQNGMPAFSNFLIVPSVMVAQQSNGDWGSISGGKQASQEFIKKNPLRDLNKKDWSKSSTENSMYDLGFDIKPIKNLVLSGQGVYNRYEYKYKKYTALQDNVNFFETGNPITGTGNDINKMEMDWRSSSKLQSTLTAKYDLTLDQHQFNILVGTAYEHYQYEKMSASRRNFPSDELQDLDGGSNAGTDITNGGGMSEYKMLSYFGRINYTFMDRYMLEANVRADASSRFHKDNRWGWFPSFSAGWRISEEAFMKDIEWLNNLKLRGSWGTLGNINNVGYYDYIANYKQSNDNSYTFDDKFASGIGESRPANNKLGWETVALTDIGIDADLFGGKLSITADYYIKNTTDILLTYNVPVETGIATAPSVNIGKVQNKGFEFSATHRNKIGEVSYQVSANLATNNNKLINVGNMNNQTYSGGDKVNYVYIEGQSVGSYFGYKTDGLYTQEEINNGHYYQLGRIPNAGDIKYVPQRENVAWGSNITADDRCIIGKDVPDFTYGLNLSANWKNFELSIFGQGVSGTSVAFESEQVWAFFLGASPRKFHMGRWNEDNPNPGAMYPRIYGGNSQDNYNQNFSDRNLFDADYFRFKTISLGYQFPKHWIQNTGMSALKLFLTGENLLTLRADNKMKDFDPEAATGRGVGAFGIKSVAFGINVSF